MAWKRHRLAYTVNHRSPIFSMASSNRLLKQARTDRMKFLKLLCTIHGGDYI